MGKNSTPFLFKQGDLLIREEWSTGIGKVPVEYRVVRAFRDQSLADAWRKQNTNFYSLKKLEDGSILNIPGDVVERDFKIK
jgi:hypothetical protein